MTSAEIGLLLLTLLPPAREGQQASVVEVQEPHGGPAAGLVLTPFRLDANGLERQPAVSVDAAGRAVLPENTDFLLVGTPNGACGLIWERPEKTLRLPPCSVRKTRVVTASGGKPAPGAAGLCLAESDWRRLDGYDPGSGGGMGQDGMLDIRAVPAADVCRVVSEGSAPSFVKLAQSPGRAPTLVALSPGAPVTGTLVDAAGRPVSERLIRVAVPIPGRTRQDSPSSWLVVARMRTDKGGSFASGPLPGGVRVIADDGKSPPAFGDRLDTSGGPLRLTLPVEARIEVSLVRGGKPLPGARVTAEQFDAARPAHFVVRDTVTDEDGRCVLSGLSSTLNRTRVTATAPDGGYDRRVFSEPLREKIEIEHWDVAKVALVRGAAVTSGGIPVRGAHVLQAGIRRELATTGSDGTFVATVPADQGLSVLVESPGFLPAAAELHPPGPVRVVLSSMARLTMRIRASDGTPVQKATLYREHLGVRQDGVAGMATANEMIEFTIKPGSAHWILGSDGLEDLDLGLLEMEPGEARSLGSVEMDAGAFVEGRIRDAASGEAVAGALVTGQPVREGDLFDVLRDTLPVVRSAPDGSFRLAGLPRGTCRLFVEAPSYAVLRRDVDALPEGTRIEDLLVSRGHELAVLLRRADGSVLPHEDVRVRPGGFDGTLKESAFSSDEDGVVHVPRIGPGRFGFVVMRSSTSFRRIVEIGEHDRELGWTVGGATLRGRVLRRGQGVANVPVMAMMPGKGVRFLERRLTTQDGVPLESTRFGDASVGGTTVSDQDGRFQFQDLPEGTILVFAAAPGWATGAKAVVLSDKGEALVDVDLDGTAAIVQLRDRDGNPVPAGRIALITAEGYVTSGTTADEGGDCRFLLENPSAIVGFLGTDAASRRGRVRMPSPLAAPVVLRLEEGFSRVDVRVLLSDGQPASSAHVVLRNEEEGSVLMGRTDRQGRLRIENVALGRHWLVTEGPDSSFGAEHVSITNSFTDVTVPLKATGTLALRFDAPLSALDPQKLKVQVVDLGGDDFVFAAALLGRRDSFDDRDLFWLPILPAGSYRVRAFDKTRDYLNESVEVKAGRIEKRVVRPR